MAFICWNPTPTYVLDDDGFPLVGALAHFCVSGTQVLTTVYADAAGTTLLNPVATQTGGRLPKVFVNTAIATRVIFTDSGGNLATPLTNLSCDPINTTTFGLQPILAVAGINYAVGLGQMGQVIARTHTANMADTLPAANTLTNGSTVTIWNRTALYTDTVTAAAGTIDGAASLIIQAGQQTLFRTDGVDWFSVTQSLNTGFQSEPWPIGAWNATQTAGAGALTRSEQSLGFNFDFITFANAGNTSVYSQATTRNSYSAGTMKFRAWGYATGGVLGETVKMMMAGRCAVHGDSIDVAYGADATATIAITGANQLFDTGWVAFTPNGDGAGEFLGLRMTRDVADTSASGVVILAVEIGGNLIKGNDA